MLCPRAVLALLRGSSLLLVFHIFAGAAHACKGPLPGDALHVYSVEQNVGILGEKSADWFGIYAQESQDSNDFSALLCKMVPELKERLTEQLLKKQTASM